jgi:hypothetical protein
MREVEFRELLDEHNAFRVRFSIDKGQLIRFVVQLESKIENKWHPIVRYDTAHGFAHQDVLHPYNDAQKITLNLQNYNEALTFAIQDLSENWVQYIR